MRVTQMVDIYTEAPKYITILGKYGWKILKFDGRDGRDPQNREKNAPAGRFTCINTLVSV
jgi:hypothetical protein